MTIIENTWKYFILFYAQKQMFDTCFTILNKNKNIKTNN